MWLIFRIIIFTISNQSTVFYIIYCEDLSWKPTEDKLGGKYHINLYYQFLTDTASVNFKWPD